MRERTSGSVRMESEGRAWCDAWYTLYPQVRDRSEPVFTSGDSGNAKPDVNQTRKPFFLNQTIAVNSVKKIREGGVPVGRALS